MMPGRLWTCTQLWSKCSTSSLRLLGHHWAEARWHGFFHLDDISWIVFLQFFFNSRWFFSALKNVDLRNWIINIQKKIMKIGFKNHEVMKHSTTFSAGEAAIFWGGGPRWIDETTNGIFEGQKNLMWDLPWNMWIVLWHGQRTKKNAQPRASSCAEKKRLRCCACIVIETSWRCPVVTDGRVEPCDQGSWWYWI